MTPRIALVQIGHRGDLYMPRCNESLAFCADWPWSHHIVIDDSETRLGGAASVQRAWAQLRALPDPPDYVFHVEEDFVLLEAPLAEMAELLDADRKLAQMVLRRQTAGRGIEGPHGFIGDNPDDFEQMDGWLKHCRNFSLNPCLYPTHIARRDWPNGGHEHHFSKGLLDEGFYFGVWGTKEDAPRCIHIGNIRGPHWKW